MWGEQNFLTKLALSGSIRLWFYCLCLLLMSFSYVEWKLSEGITTLIQSEVKGVFWDKNQCSVLLTETAFQHLSLGFSIPRFYLLNPKTKSHDLNSNKQNNFRDMWINCSCAYRIWSHLQFCKTILTVECYSSSKAELVMFLLAFKEVFVHTCVSRMNCTFMGCSFSWPTILQKHIHPLWNISGIWTRQK